MLNPIKFLYACLIWLVASVAKGRPAICLGPYIYLARTGEHTALLFNVRLMAFVGVLRKNARAKEEFHQLGAHDGKRHYIKGLQLAWNAGRGKVTMQVTPHKEGKNGQK